MLSWTKKRKILNLNWFNFYRNFLTECLPDFYFLQNHVIILETQFKLKKYDKNKNKFV